MKKIPPIITPIAIVSIGLALGATTTIVNSSPTYGLKKENTTTTVSSTEASNNGKKDNSQTESTNLDRETSTTASEYQETMDTTSTVSTDSTESSTSAGNQNNEGSTTTAPADNFIEQSTPESSTSVQN